jgi:hypothetical protein
MILKRIRIIGIMIQLIAFVLFTPNFWRAEPTKKESRNNKIPFIPVKSNIIPKRKIKIDILRVV